ncbi:hypothetical protein PK98_11290 [Croceibacterium mercuriale]|uniref:Uncharacterized protein n=1 Tax=Croceibacterium mercuriale TaxID=1572751 RepID=A0A0B2BT02_9SPHN|nr:hypothetical protein [Croceibacterium mercuriale]KHL24564.1 hypothetical protein PK98_11290 [Croceibacterium mercuriale]
MQMLVRASALRNFPSMAAALVAALAIGVAPAVAQGARPAAASAQGARAADAPRNGSAPALPTGPASSLTYPDIAGLVEDAGIVAVVQVRRQAVVDAARAPGLAAGRARLYLETTTQALLAAPTPVGQELSFLADVPLTDRGRVPKLRKQRFVIFADTVPGRAGQLQLVQPDAMMPADPAFEARLRQVITQFADGDVPPPVTGVRHVLYTPGNLAGESETQMIVETATGVPASISVIRRPNMAPQWGVSWSEIIDQSATPPAPDTPGWYRLACGLPRELANDAFLTGPGSDRQRARADYQVVLDALGPCTRTRT